MKPATSRAAALVMAATAAPALAGTISQVVDFSHGFDGEIVTFEKFDTLGGARALTGMSLSYAQRITMDFHVESNGPTAVAAGDWEILLAYNSLHQFGLVHNDPDPPFIGPGALFEGGITAPLGASDGYNGSGLDTYHGSVDTGHFVFDASYDTSTDFGIDMLDTFTGVGLLETFFSGFTELFGGWNNDPNWVVDPNNPPDGPFDIFEDPYYGFFVTIDDLLQQGQITLVYEYITVPAPATASLAALALLATRRRRGAGATF